jgi:two-component system, NarL family, nitrate/nitrite response regulator NarL
VPKIELLLRSQLVKDALSSVLAEAGFSVFLEQGQRNHDTILITDFEDCKGLESVQTHQSRGVKIVALTSETDSGELEPDNIVALSGVLTHDLSLAAFVRSLWLICSGERVFPPGPSREQNSATASRATAPQSDDVGLSPQEKELLSQALEGHSNQVIARDLRITEAEAKAHFGRLLRKLKVDNRTQAVIWALANLPGLGTIPHGFGLSARAASEGAGET